MKRFKRILIIIILAFLSVGAVYLFLGFRYHEQELIIRSGNREIYGHLFQPQFSGSQYPLVVLGHGYGGSFSDNLDYGRYFSKHGIACYVFDFCGGSENSRSSKVDMSLYTEIEDMNGIIDYMLKQPWLKEGQLFLAGKSLGGTVAAFAAAQRPEEIGGLILHYPYFVVSEALGGDGSSYVVEDVFERIAGFHGPVLIFNGDKDKYVPLEYTKQAAAAYENAELVVIKGSGHGFSGADRTKVKEQMVKYILGQGDVSDCPNLLRM